MARLETYQLQGKSTLWWEEIKMTWGIEEQEITWHDFQKHFKDNYLTERFYNQKENEFHNLRLGQLTMEEFVNKFMPSLRYVPYILEGKYKVQCFISSLPIFMKEKMEFDNLKIINEGIWKTRIFYQQMKQKGEGGRSGLNKKGLKSFLNDKNEKKIGGENVYRKQQIKFWRKNQQKFGFQTKTSQTEVASKPESSQSKKPPLQG